MRIILALLCVLLTSCSTAKRQNLEDANWRSQFHCVSKFLEEQKSLDGAIFSIKQTGKSNPLPSPQILDYPVISCTAVIEKFPPEKECVLYCPHTGCPYHPELEIPILIDSNGVGQVLCSRDKDGNAETKPLDNYIELFAIPGYTSDWYLISDNWVKHASFTCQPNTCKGPKNQQLTISKKEPGGNYLRVELTGFQPSERVLLTLNFDGIEMRKHVFMIEDGSYGLFLETPFINNSKGVVKVTAQSGECLLRTACDWDLSTLLIPRVQEKSVYRSSFSGKGLGNKQVIHFQ